MNREYGYYWIKWNDEEEWTIAEWRNDCAERWSIVGSELYYPDSEIEVGAKIERPTKTV